MIKVFTLSRGHQLLHDRSIGSDTFRRASGVFRAENENSQSRDASRLATGAIELQCAKAICMPLAFFWHEISGNRS